MRVFAFLDGGAAIVGGVVDLAGEALDHRLLRPLAGVEDQPTHAEGDAAGRPYLDGHLIRRAADPA